MDAILTYYLTGEEPPFSNPLLQGFFKMFSKVMDEDAILYEKKCKSNEQAIRKRWSKEKENSERIPPNTNEYQLINKSINELNNELTKEDDVNIILASSPITKEDLLRKHTLTEEQLHHYGELFNEENKGKKYNGSDNPIKYFQNWLGKRIKKEKEENDKERTKYGGFTPSSNHNDTTF